MFKLNLYKKQNNRQIQSINRKPFIFGFMSVFLSGIGFSMIMPIIPFLVQPYVTNSANETMIVTLLTCIYAVCVFFSAPILGALSDRYGRRPLLLICILGSAIGYFVFGIGGALWVLFAGRIIDGITGGNISILFAYFADITPSKDRTKYFGWMSAILGIACAIGPTLGGFLAKFGYSVPLYFGAIITLINFIYGIFYMPESLDNNNKLEKITARRINPFVQLVDILSMKSLKRLLIAAFLLWIANGSLQAIFSLFIIDTFNWTPAIIGLMFSIMGIQDMISQGLIMPRLLKRFSDVQIVVLGMISEVIGYALIGSSALFSFYPLFIIGMFIFGFGDSIFGPAFNGILSKSADAKEQGKIQGGSQSIQSLSRIIGPIIGGQIYISLGHIAPAFMGAVLTIGAIFILRRVSLLHDNYNKTTATL